MSVIIDAELLAAGREIARLRAARGISQERLAEVAGLHRNYVGMVERGERNPTLKTLLAIADALDTGLADLFTTIPRRPAHHDRGDTG
jgi:transcriptional regulator with XRE-family HTH domain